MSAVLLFTWHSRGMHPGAARGLPGPYHPGVRRPADSSETSFEHSEPLTLRSFEVKPTVRERSSDPSVHSRRFAAGDRSQARSVAKGGRVGDQIEFYPQPGSWYTYTAMPCAESGRSLGLTSKDNAVSSRVLHG